MSATPRNPAPMTSTRGATGRSGRPSIGLAVVIPARNEEHRLPACLEAIIRAESVLRQRHPQVRPTEIVVVLDRCTDGTAQVAERWPQVQALVSDYGNVGAARAAGVRFALQARGGQPAPEWIACTDADSVVPPEWLVGQLTHASAGTDLLLGLALPDPAEVPAQVMRRWTARHRLTDGHSHVHGANLGIRTAMYLRAGGFPALAEHEDVALVDRVQVCGGTVVSTADQPVLTSGRTTGRTPGGMAGYLHDLARAAT